MSARNGITSTYTFVILEISQIAYDEIRAKLDDAGYSHTFISDSDKSELIDMHGIALKVGE